MVPGFHPDRTSSRRCHRGWGAGLAVLGILGVSLLSLGIFHKKGIRTLPAGIVNGAAKAGNEAAHGISELAVEFETTVEGRWEGIISGNKDKREAIMRSHKLNSDAFVQHVDEDEGKGIMKKKDKATNPFAKWAEEFRLKAEEQMWEVVSENSVNIMARKSLGSQVIGSKSKCALVMGWRNRDWVKLIHGGFMKISLGGMLLLRNVTISYERILNGTCADIGWFPITDPDMCRVAATSLNLADKIVKGTDKQPLPEGCYLFENMLWLATNPNNNGKGVVGPMEPLCSSHAPCHPTTTTTTTSTSTSTSVTSLTTTKTATTTTITTSITTSITTTSTSTLSSTSSATTSTSTTSSWPFPSLFCFSVTRTVGTEPELLNAQFARHASIFACDEYAVFSNGGKMWIGSIETVEIPAPPVVLGDLSQNGVTTSSWLNTMIFMELWKLIGQDGRFHRHDWVVKLDPDAVFFPERLRRLLRPHSTPGISTYLANCGKFQKLGWSTFYGSIEVFSVKAVETYLDGWRACKQNLQWKGWGEDLYMKSCMEMLGVGHIDSFDMLADKRCDWAPCNDPTKVAYHDFKDVGSYVQCWEESKFAQANMAHANGVVQ